MKSGNKTTNTALKTNTQPELKSRPVSRRTRKTTLLKLGWLAERLRKTERIKREIAAGTYHVDSMEVARAMLNADMSSFDL